jgi:hypothetical protein
LRVLVACEESQAVCKAFREKGHEAYSCDIIDCSGGHPEWHIKGDVLKILNPSSKQLLMTRTPTGIPQENCVVKEWQGITFQTMDGKWHTIDGKWDMIIAHPPCTFLSTAATQCHSTKCFSKEQIAQRTLKRIEGMKFFMAFVNADCEKIVIENPTGVMNTCFRQPDQTIHPYYFAESVEDKANYYTKKTGLWLKGVEPLTYSVDLPNPMDNADKWGNGKKKNWTESNSGGRARSKTPTGVAKAFADQWG